MSGKDEKPPMRLMQIAPLFPVALGLVVGILFDRSMTPPALLFSVLLVAATIGTLSKTVRRRASFGCVLAGAIGVGGILHVASARVTPSDSVERYAGTSGVLARLRGTVVHEPKQLSPPPTTFPSWAHRTRRTGFVLAVESVAGQRRAIPVLGNVRVTVFEPVLDLAEGEQVEVFGRLFALRTADNPGSVDWEGFHRRRGIVARMNCQHREAVQRLRTGDRRNWGGWLTVVRQRVRRLLVDEVAADADGTSGLLEGLILGQRSQVSRMLNELFVRAGCIHFLAVSGVHLVLVMWLARTTVRLFGAGGRFQILAMMGAIVFYALVAEPRPPILRASIIAAVYCVACLLGRQRACLNWISACVIILAVAQPAMVFDVGYQLSTTAVLGVSYLAPALHPLIGRFLMACPSVEDEGGVDRGGAVIRFLRFFRWKLSIGISITLAAWLAGLPIVATVFHRLHPWGAINSLLLLPVVTLIMAAGFMKMIVGVVSPTAGAYMGAGLDSLGSRFVDWVELLGNLPRAAVTVAEPPLIVVGLAYLTMLLFVLARQQRSRAVSYFAADEPDANVAPIIPAWPSAVSAAALAVSLAVWMYPITDSGRLTLSVLSVGRGSATVIRLPTGATIVYDAGSSFASDPGLSTVVPYLLHRGITEVDRVFISHANLDHFSGVPTIVDLIATGPVVVNRHFAARSPPRSPSGKLLRILRERGHPVATIGAAPVTWRYGDVSIDCLWPTGELGSGYTTNDTSTVLRLTYAGRRILLTGDIEQSAQRWLIDHGGLAADVLVLPHHGSVVATTEEFVSAVNPSIVIRSSNERMRATQNGLDRIAAPYRLYNTADVGAIEITIDRRGLAVATAHPTGAVAGAAGK